MFRKEANKLREVAKKGEAKAAVLNGLQADVLLVSYAVAKLLLVTEKAQNVR